ncbi:MAG: hypothetical protein IJ609_02780 [Paludibacteraceae bacterium]|nr:hypothetical protein [Paludibacteraceae bacterium]
MTDDLGTQWFMYTGSNKETTREFCEHLTAKKYIHRSEIPTILTGKIEYNGEVHQCAIYPKTNLPYGMIEGTTPENFQCNCGGWNCRHQLVPVADAVVPASLRAKFAQPATPTEPAPEPAKQTPQKRHTTTPIQSNTKQEPTVEQQPTKRVLTPEQIKERQELTRIRRNAIESISRERKTNKLKGEQFHTGRLVCTKKDIKNIIKHCISDDEIAVALDIDKYLFSLSNGEREELVEKENTQKKRDRGVKYYTKYTFTTADGNKYLLKCEAIQTESDSRITEHPYFLKKI